MSEVLGQRRACEFFATGSESGVVNVYKLSAGTCEVPGQRRACVFFATGSELAVVTCTS